jgi:putative membrane protein
MTVVYDASSSYKVLFQLGGSVWLQVLPYCIANVLLTGVIYWCIQKEWQVSFSPQGHALMSLIVSFLVVSKINLAYERYMHARTAVGKSMQHIRELNQLAVVFTEYDTSTAANNWRFGIKTQSISLLNHTVRAIKDEEKALIFAQGASHNLAAEDPLTHVKFLRSQICSGSSVLPTEMPLLEKSKLLDTLSRFVDSHEGMLKLASTPLPFPLVQMGRTFLFLWIFSMPLVLVGHVFYDLYSTVVFVFFLTYGFIGLEFVGMQMLNPFGDGINDIGLEAIAQATVYGIENDTKLCAHPQAAYEYKPPSWRHLNTSAASLDDYLQVDDQV